MAAPFELGASHVTVTWVGDVLTAFTPAGALGVDSGVIDQAPEVVMVNAAPNNCVPVASTAS